MWWALAMALAQPVATDPPGRWYPEAEAERIAQLQALGYLGATEPAPPVSGVTVQTARAGDGVNLLSSGHAPYAALVAMDGTVLHQWARAFSDSFPGRPELADHRSAGSWRHVTLLPDGGLLAIHEGIGLVRLGQDSRLIWAVPNRAHHDLVVHDGRVFVLTRALHRRGEGLPVLEDFVAELSLATGERVRRFSVLRAVAASDRPQWAEPAVDSGDVLHTNSLWRLTATQAQLHPAWSEGDWLLGSRVHGFVAVMAQDTGALVWSTTGPWRRQHDVQLDADGQLWLFDNQGSGEGRSRVLALDPHGQQVLGQWDRGGALYSEVLGAVQPLPDGQLLVTESTRGRAWQVDRGTGEVVWAYTNPAQREGLIGALYAVRRVPWAEVPWLPRPSGGIGDAP